MRKIFFLILFFLTVGMLSAQTVRNMKNASLSDTLKTGLKDTLTVRTDYPYNSRFTVTAKTVSGTDTIYVSTVSRDSVFTTTKLLIDLSTGSPVNYIIATTTPLEYLIYDPLIIKMRLRKNNPTKSAVVTLFTVSRK